MNTVSRTRAPMPLPAVAGLGIAAGLAVVSYGHIFSVARLAGAAPWEAAIIAATVDGLIVMSLATIALARRYGQKPPPVAKVALVIGVAATGGANLVHGIAYGWAGVAVAVWVPLVAEVAYLLAMAALRIVQNAADTSTEGRPVICGPAIVPVAAVMAGVRVIERAEAVAAAGGRENGHAVAAAERPVICGHDVPVAAVMVRARRLRRPAASDAGVAAKVSAVEQHTAPVPPVATGELAAAVAALPGLDERDREVAVAVATGQVATGADVATLAGCSGRTGRRVLQRVSAAMAAAGGHWADVSGDRVAGPVTVGA